MLAFFKASTYTELGDSRTTLFWDDRWIQGSSAADLAPNLMQLVSRRTRARMSVRQGITNRQWMRTITGSMNMITTAEYLDLWEAMTHVIMGDQPNKVRWHCTPDGQYTFKSAYKMLHTGSVSFRGHSLIWKTWALLRIKIFLWLTFRRRHWTND